MVEKLEKEKHLLIEQICRYAPQLRPFFTYDRSVCEHSLALHSYVPDSVYRNRQMLITAAVKEKIAALFGDAYAASCRFDVSAMNIVDHHQVLNHPLLLAGNVIANAGSLCQTERGDPIVVLSSGDVPPNNFFSKNGFQFHGRRVPLFSNSETELISYYLPVRDFDFVSRQKRIGRWHEWGADEQRFLTALGGEWQAIDYSSCANYLDQITLVVKQSWPRLFEPFLRNTLPDLIYVTQEDVVSRALQTLLPKDSIIRSMLFDASIRAEILNRFRGIVVAWNEVAGKGTHFFWRKHPTEDRSLRMYLEGDMLVPHDDRYRDCAIAFTPADIVRALETKEIYPSLFMIFWVLHFYSGIRPLLGYGSIMYMNLLRDAWLVLFDSLGKEFGDERERVAKLPLDGLIVGPAIFFKKSDGYPRALYAADLMYEGGATREYLEKIFSMPFRELFTVALPELYPYVANKYIPAHDRRGIRFTADNLAGDVFGWV